MRRNLTKTCIGVISKASVALAEVAERKTIEMPAMRGITKGAEVRVMRRDDYGTAARRKQTVKLFYGAHHVRDMLDQVDRSNLNERAIAKRKGIVIQVSDYIGTSVEVPIDPNRARILVDPAAYIED